MGAAATVHLSYVREKTGHALAGARQWIPAEDIRDPVKSLVTGLPLNLRFRTKGQLAIGILAGAYADGPCFDFFCGDEAYGSCTERWHARAWLVTASPRHSLLARRHLKTGELAFHYCFTPDGHAAPKARLIRAAGLANGFASCDDPAGLQEICDRLQPGTIEVFAQRWLHRIPMPFDSRDRDAGYW